MTSSAPVFNTFSLFLVEARRIHRSLNLLYTCLTIMINSKEKILVFGLGLVF